MFDLDELARADDALHALADGSFKATAPETTRKSHQSNKPGQCPFRTQHREHAA